MEIIRNVGDIDSQDRQALEHVLGYELRANQQLVIRVVNLQVQPETPAKSHGNNGGAELPGWLNVYAGLSDVEIADLEKTILTRADLSRPTE